jgi:hypothetical protein
LTQPVIITWNGRDCTVMISVEEYHRLKRRDRQVLAAWEFPPQRLEAIRRAEPPAEAAAFDHEYNAGRQSPRCRGSDRPYGQGKPGLGYDGLLAL